MRALVLALVLLLAPALAGCTDTPAAEPDLVDPASGDEPQDPTPETPTPPTNGSAPSDDETPADEDDDSAPRENGTAPGGDEEGSPPATTRTWGDIDAATIRPGVQVYAGGAQCTSNFVYTSPDGAEIYLGLAAHCVEGLDLGASLDIDGQATGTLAYSSWIAMGYVSEGGVTSGGTCETEGVTDEECRFNDFALVRIPRDAHDKVHPAMLHFGGPTSLADSGAVAMGDKVLTYGRSGLRPGIEPLSWHEGVVTLKDGAWSHTVYTATPGIPGDSGSGVLTGDGKALGILVTVHFTPDPGANGVTNLDKALAYAKEHAGLDVRLVTWDLVDSGLLPL